MTETSIWKQQCRLIYNKHKLGRHTPFVIADTSCFCMFLPPCACCLDEHAFTSYFAVNTREESIVIRKILRHTISTPCNLQKAIGVVGRMMNKHPPKHDWINLGANFQTNPLCFRTRTCRYKPLGKQHHWCRVLLRSSGTMWERPLASPGMLPGKRPWILEDGTDRIARIGRIDMIHRWMDRRIDRWIDRIDG